MEITDWLVVIAIIALLFYAKINYPTQFHSAMGVIEDGFKALFKAIEGAIPKGSANTTAEPIESTTEQGGG